MNASQFRTAGVGLTRNYPQPTFQRRRRGARRVGCAAISCLRVSDCDVQVSQHYNSAQACKSLLDVNSVFRMWPARERYGHVRAHRNWSLGRDRNRIATPRGHRLLTWSEEDGHAEVHLQNFSGVINDLGASVDEDIISKFDALGSTSGRRIQEPLPARHIRFAD